MKTETERVRKTPRPMAAWLRKLPIRHKLVMIIMLVSSVTLLLASAAFISYHWFSYRQRIVDDLSVHSEMLAENMTAALSFDDQQDARELLASLKVKSSIALACVYRGDGTVFATYHRKGVSKLTPPDPEPDGYYFKPGWLVMFKQIILNRQSVGTVYLQSDLHELSAFVRHSISVLGLLILLATVVAFMLSEKLQKMISLPILHLSETAETVSQYKDYSVRAIKENEDELGVLTDALNNMLGQVQDRDRALRESEEKYRNILESIEDAYIEVDLAGNVTFFNKSLCRMSGYSPEELKGMNNRQFMDDENVEKSFRVFNTVFKTGKTSSITDIDFIKKDGSTYSVEILVSPIYGADDRPIGFRGIVRDISDRKIVEKEKRRLWQQLRHAQKMEAIGTLAGGIAHDFNNILSGIIGNAELALLYELSKDHPAYHRIDQILKASHRASDLTRQILTFSRGQEMELKEIFVSPVIKEAVKLLRASLPTTIDFIVEIATESDTVFGDASSIHQIIMNLCTNAAHAMQKTGGTLKISAEKVYLNPEACGRFPNLIPGDYLRLSISDTGQGIEPSIKERIFEPYFTTKKPEEGTGLGLSVVHGIVMSFGGEITVDSEPGKGSTFAVLLPMLGQASEPVLANFEQFRTGNEHILFVDDEEILLEIGKDLLSKLGYQVTTKLNGHDAFEFFKSQPEEIDLVITDMTMPQLTGDKLALELIKIRSDIPVILCTGYSKSITEDKALQMGIRELVMKPLTLNKISQALRNVLDDESSHGV